MKTLRRGVLLEASFGEPYSPSQLGLHHKYLPIALGWSGYVPSALG